MLSRKYGPWAIVVGASRGIGKAFAVALAEDGFNLVLLARNRTLLETLARDLASQHGIQTRVMTCDLSETDALLGQLERETADLDIGLLVANAAVSEFAQAHRADAAESLAVLRTNVMAMMLLCHHFAARFVARGGGGILPVSSNGAYCMLPNQANYAASKAYVAHYGEILHYELRARGVDVTTLFPPLVDTDMISALQSNQEWMFDRMPFGFGVKADPAMVARAGLQGLARRRLRVHPPFAASVFMWIVRRLPDRARCGLFNYMFAKAVDTGNRWW